MSTPHRVDRRLTGLVPTSILRAWISRTPPPPASRGSSNRSPSSGSAPSGRDGLPHLVPIWFSWDGETVLIASKPHAKKVANLRVNPRVMLALGEPDEDFDVGLLEGVAEILDEPSAGPSPRSHLRKYRDQLAAIGLDREEFLATYSLVDPDPPDALLPVARPDDARQRPIRAGPRADRRLQAAVRRVAETLVASQRRGEPRIGRRRRPSGGRPIARRSTVSGGASGRRGSRGPRSVPVGP